MKKRFQLRMYYADGEKNTAASKATRDCASILSSIGFKEIEIPIYNNRLYTFLNIFQAFNLFYTLLFKINRGAIVVISYPLLGINKYLKNIASTLNIKKCKSVILIHDLNSLRKFGSYISFQDEIAKLNSFDYIISHNSSMTRLLKNDGLKVPAVDLILFDYLLSEDLVQKTYHQSFKRNIAFAGNLEKSGFIKDLNLITSINFQLFGPGYTPVSSAKNVKWEGSFAPEILPQMINAGFGLIWDGDSIYTCKGPMGEYLKYNNPHKASLYVVSELPLVAPNQTAIGKYITEKNIGFTINSLTELEDVIDALTTEEYSIMKKNIRHLYKIISSGGNLKRCIQTIDWA